MLPLLALSRFFDQNAANFSDRELNKLYNGIRLSDGTKRTTARGRLASVDEMLLRELEPREQPYRILDIGISSGVTTEDLARRLHEGGITCEIHAVDRVFSIDSARILGGLTIHCEAKSKHVIQIEVAGVGIRAWIRRMDYVTGAFLWRYPLLALARSFAKRATRFRNFQFVVAGLRALPNVHLHECDVLGEWPAELKSMDVVRIANLLQSVYFSEQEMSNIIRKIKNACRGNGSIVIVCRDLYGQLDGSLFRMDSSGNLNVVRRLGKGSLVEHLLTVG